MRSVSVDGLLTLGNSMHEEMYDWGGSVVFKPQRTVPFRSRKQVAVARLLPLLAICTRFCPKQNVEQSSNPCRRLPFFFFFVVFAVCPRHRKRQRVRVKVSENSTALY